MAKKKAIGKTVGDYAVDASKYSIPSGVLASSVAVLISKFVLPLDEVALSAVIVILTVVFNALGYALKKKYGWKYLD